MAARQTDNGMTTIDAVLELVKDLNERTLAAAREVGSVSIDSYEKAVNRALEAARSLLK